MITSPSEIGAGCNRNLRSAEKSYIDDDDDDDRFSQPRNTSAQGANRCVGIAPYSISSAIWKFRNFHNEGNSAMRAGWCASDIVAIVLSATTRFASTPNAKVRDAPCITLLIGDNSLPSGKCARVTIPATSSNLYTNSLSGVGGMGGSALNTTPGKSNSKHTADRLGELQPGDIVRLNRLEVRHDYDNDLSLRKKREFTEDDNADDVLHNPLLSVACDLTMSWRDPEPGPTLARLCRIIPSPPHSKDDNCARVEQGQHDTFELVLEFVPPRLETPKENMMELANWYCANLARRHNSKSTSIFRATQRCQRRKLRDITKPNLLSNIVVKVLRCEKAIPLFSTPNKEVEKSDLTHATLSDGPESDDIMGMVGLVIWDGHITVVAGARTIPNPISSVMLQSMNDGAHVLLTHVLSHAPRGNDASSLILAPTRETTATILTPDHPYFVYGRYPSTREDVKSHYSQQFVGMTQLSYPISGEMRNESILPSYSRGIMAVIAPLQDIIVNGIDTSFMEGSHWQSPYALSRFLIDSPIVSTGLNSFVLSPSYRSATLILDQQNKSMLVEKRSDGKDDTIVVHACEDSMKILCMDVPVEDMVMQNPKAAAIVDTPNHPYLNHVGTLLRTLCTESIPIQWVLEQESECHWFVMNATIIEI